MLKYFFLTFILVAVAVVAIAGFRGETSPRPPIEILPDMDHQPKYQPQHPSDFFADHRGARRPVTGTVAQGFTMPGAYYTTTASNSRVTPSNKGFSGANDYYNTGKMAEFYGDGMPIEVSAAMIHRGRERFDINCSVCHGAAGAGNGIVAQSGMVGVANLHDERIRTMPDGQIFNTITHGKNTMGPYGPQITVEDRWAIVAYLRALQRSQFAKLDDVPPEHRAALDQAAGAAKP